MPSLGALPACVFVLGTAVLPGPRRECVQFATGPLLVAPSQRQPFARVHRKECPFLPFEGRRWAHTPRAGASSRAFVQRRAREAVLELERRGVMRCSTSRGYLSGVVPQALLQALDVAAKTLSLPLSHNKLCAGCGRCRCWWPNGFPWQNSPRWAGLPLYFRPVEPVVGQGKVDVDRKHGRGLHARQ